MTSEKIIGFVAEQFGVEAESLSRETNFVDDLNADSLDVVELVMSIEEEYDIVITDERAGNVRTVAQVVEMLESLVK